MRVVALIDMDCFYVQVEQRCIPELWGKPTAVVQYNQWRRGGIIAVGYEARARGVKRGMRGDEALAVCPEINLVSVPTQRNKADLTKYREASAEVFAVLSKFDDVIVERASIDEAYLDLTSFIENQLKNMDLATFQFDPNDFPTTHLAVKQTRHDDSSDGYMPFSDWLKELSRDVNNELRLDDLKLCLGGRLVERIRQRVLDDTKFHCSAGIASNKMLAKLVCSIHKPKKQTLIPTSLIPTLFLNTQIQDVRLLGGKLGDSVVQKLNIKTMAELSHVTLNQLREHFDQKTCDWLMDLSHGLDDEPITPRQLPKSIGCSKNFPGKQSLRTRANVHHWLTQLAEELEERLTRDQQANVRVARTLVVGLRTEGDSSAVCCTRQTSLPSYNADIIVREGFRLLQEFNTCPNKNNISNHDIPWKPHIVSLSIAAGRFEDSADLGTMQITKFFKISAAEKIKTPQKKFAYANEGATTSSSSKPGTSAAMVNSGEKSKDSFFMQIMAARSAEKSAQKARDDSLTRNNTDTPPCVITIDDKSRDSLASIDTDKPSSSVNTSKVAEKLDFSSVTADKKNDHVILCGKNAGSDDSQSKNAPESRDPAPPINDENISESPNDYPEKREDIDEETWRQLTPEIRFELTHFYNRKNGSIRVKLIGEKSAAKVGKSRKPGQKSQRKKIATTKKGHSPMKKQRAKSVESGSTVTLHSFFNKA